MKTKSILLMAVLALAFGASAQDQFFFNNHQTLLFTNPSYAGSNGLIRNQNLFKKNFSGSDNIDTYVSSVDGYLAPLKAGLGLSFVRSEIWGGAISTNHLAFTYAQHIKLKKDLKIIPSFQVAYGDKTYRDFWASTTGRSSGLTTRFVDISSGVLMVYRNFHIGATVFHINKPNTGVVITSRLPSAFSLNTSYSAAFSESCMLNISGRIYAGENYHLYQVGWNLLFLKNVLIGIGARQEEASVVFGTIGYRNNFMSAGFSYGQAPNRLPTGQLNQSEFMFSYFLRDKAHRKDLSSFETW